MDTQTIRVPQHAFFGDTELELPLPAAWEVVMRPMPGAFLPPLSDDAVRQALAAPTGTPPLRELARGKHQVAILFDDIARPTPVSRLWPFVVEELHAAGITDDRIRFVVALGTHAAHSRADFVAKLGKEALCRFPVYNHNCYARCSHVGFTRNGTPIEVNDEVLSCDLRIAIGSVLPHPSMGFGGGPKIILPGVSSYKTITAHHAVLMPQIRLGDQGHTLTMGYAEGPAWRDIAEAAELAQLDFIVNATLNQSRGVVGLVCGHFIEAWRQGVALVQQQNATEPVPGADIVISNGYGKGNESMISAFARNLGHGTAPGGADAVGIANCPNGTVVHYLQGDFGEASWSDRIQVARGLPPGIRHMLIYNRYPEISSRRFFGNLPWAQFLSDWDVVLTQLIDRHPGDARVAVYPDLTVQYLVVPEKQKP